MKDFQQLGLQGFTWFRYKDHLLPPHGLSIYPKTILPRNTFKRYTRILLRVILEKCIPDHVILVAWRLPLSLHSTFRTHLFRYLHTWYSMETGRMSAEKEVCLILHYSLVFVFPFLSNAHTLFCWSLTSFLYLPRVIIFKICTVLLRNWLLLVLIPDCQYFGDVSSPDAPVY